MKIEELEFQDKKAEVAIRNYKQIKDVIFSASEEGFHPLENLSSEYLINVWATIWMIVRSNGSINTSPKYEYHVPNTHKASTVFDRRLLQSRQVLPTLIVIYVDRYPVARLYKI